MKEGEMAKEIKCPNDGRDCPVDPVQLEGRLVRIETKLDQIIEKQKQKQQDAATPEAAATAGLSGKSVAGWSILNSTFLVAAYELVKTWLATKGIKIDGQ
jgi:hypothetical protein